MVKYHYKKINRFLEQLCSD